MRASLKRRGVNQAVDGAVLDLVAGRVRGATTTAEVVEPMQSTKQSQGSKPIIDQVPQALVGCSKQSQSVSEFQSDFSARDLHAATFRFVACLWVSSCFAGALTPPLDWYRHF
jgi:hypothetical protein